MKVIGIIAEYNPFHRGHAYQIEKLKQEIHADYVVIAMSGNFVQRGAPALMDKYSRASMALSCGADLVLELPVLYATASAEYFARGGVALLNHTGVVTHLGFGAESNAPALLQEIAEILVKQPETFRKTLQQELKEGSSFPVARSQALKVYVSSLQTRPTENISSGQQEKTLPSLSPHAISSKQLGEMLSSPNNILAIEYYKALSCYDSGIIPCPILRQGKGYHDTAMDNSGFCSASAIRSQLKKESSALENNCSSENPAQISLSADAMPAASYEILKKYPHPFLFEDDFSTLVHYKLLTESSEELSSYADSSPELVNRMKKEVSDFTSWSEFCDRLKTKNITYTRLSRLFLHMVLNIHKEDYQIFPAPSYLRVLGFRKDSAALLNAVKSQGTLPLITSPADAPKLLSGSAQILLSMDLKASELYGLGLAAKGDGSLKNDYQQPVIRL